MSKNRFWHTTEEENELIKDGLIKLYNRVAVLVVPSICLFLGADLILDLKFAFYQYALSLISFLVAGLVAYNRNKKWLRQNIIHVNNVFIVIMAGMCFSWYLDEPVEIPRLNLIFVIMILGLFTMRLSFTLIYFGLAAIGFAIVYINEPTLNILYLLYFILSGAMVMAINYWRTRLNKQLLQTQRNYKNIFSDSSDYIFVIDTELKVLEVNQKAENFIRETNSDDITGIKFQTLLHFQNDPDNQLLFNQLQELEAVDSVEFEAYCALTSFKEFIPYEFNIRRSSYFDKEVLIVNIRQISEQKNFEKNLIRSKENITKIVDNINAVVYNIHWKDDGDHEVNYVSSQVEKLYGISTEDYIKRIKDQSITEIIFDSDREYIVKQFQNLVKKQGELLLEYRISIDGDIRWIKEKIYANRVEGEGSVFLFGIVDDITKEKHALVQLEESEKSYRQLFELNLAGVYKVKLDGEILECNQAFAEMLGYKDTRELKGKNAFDLLITTEDTEQFINRIVEQVSLRNYTAKYRKTDGKEIYVNINATMHTLESDERLIVGTVIDVTQNKLDSEALKFSEEKYRLLFEEANNAILLMLIEEDDLIVLDANQKACEEFGFDSIKMIEGKKFTAFCSDKISPEERKERIANLKRTLESKGKVDEEWKLIKANGEMFIAEVSSSYLTIDGKPVAQMLVTDVSEKREQERLIIESRSSFKYIVENSPLSIFIFTDEKLVYMNPLGKELYLSHLNKDEEQLFQIFPQNLKFLIENLINEAQEGIHSYTEINLGMGEKRRRYSITAVNTIYQNKKSVIFQLSDISLQLEYNTQKLRAEIAEEANKKLQEEVVRHRKTQINLLEKTSRLNSIFQSEGNLYIISVDRDYNVVSFNKNFENLVKNELGKTVAPGDDFLKIFPIANQQALQKIRAKFELVFNGRPQELISHFPGGSGEIWIESFLNPLNINDDQLIEEISFISHDISDKIEFQEKIKEREASNRALVVAMPDILFQFSKEGIILDFRANSSADKEVIKAFAKTEDLIGKHVAEVFINQNVSRGFIENIKAAIQSDRLLTNHFSFFYGTDNDMREYHYENRFSKMSEEEVVVISRNITETIEYEHKLIESVKEKEILLKEVHHRVKNNLQVINSILNLQSSYVKDPETLEIIVESQNRIRSMSYIHESLYQTKNFSSINFQNYISNLVQNLVHSYEVYNEKINLVEEIDEVDLPLDQAIPCGLILNELVTNSLKYAYPGDMKGDISIKVYEKDKKVFIEVEDFGVGLPDNFNISESDSLGLSLVDTLIEQLDGELTLDNTNGTKFLIIFGKQEV